MELLAVTLLALVFALTLVAIHTHTVKFYRTVIEDFLAHNRASQDSALDTIKTMWQPPDTPPPESPTTGFGRYGDPLGMTTGMERGDPGLDHPDDLLRQELDEDPTTRFIPEDLWGGPKRQLVGSLYPGQAIPGVGVPLEPGQAGEEWGPDDG